MLMRKGCCQVLPLDLLSLEWKYRVLAKCELFALRHTFLNVFILEKNKKGGVNERFRYSPDSRRKSLFENVV